MVEAVILRRGLPQRGDIEVDVAVEEQAGVALLRLQGLAVDLPVGEVGHIPAVLVVGAVADDQLRW